MNPTAYHYIALACAIVCEVIGTAFLQMSEQFTKLIPTMLLIVFYAASFYSLTLALKAIPIGIAYAVWAGCGLVLTALIGTVVFRQTLDLAAISGIAMIVAGVIVVNLFSKFTMR